MGGGAIATAAHVYQGRSLAKFRLTATGSCLVRSPAAPNTVVSRCVSKYVWVLGKKLGSCGARRSREKRRRRRTRFAPATGVCSGSPFRSPCDMASPVAAWHPIRHVSCPAPLASQWPLALPHVGHKNELRDANYVFRPSTPETLHGLLITTTASCAAQACWLTSCPDERRLSPAR